MAFADVKYGCLRMLDRLVSTHQKILLQGFFIRLAPAAITFHCFSVTNFSYGHKVKIVHFIGATKPWHVKFDADGQPMAGPLEAHTLVSIL